MLLHFCIAAIKTKLKGLYLILIIAQMRADEQTNLSTTAFLRLKDINLRFYVLTFGCAGREIVVY